MAPPFVKQNGFVTAFCLFYLHLNLKTSFFSYFGPETIIFLYFKHLHEIVRVAHLKSSVQRGTSKLVIVFGVEHNLHHVVSVPLKHLSAQPLLVPVPQLDQHVVWKHTHIKKVTYS